MNTPSDASLAPDVEYRADIAYRDGHLSIESVSLHEIAEQVGTPVYCYSSAVLEKNFLAFAAACRESSPLICFAAKANSNLAILSLFARLGAGADVVSEGEMRKALAAGMPPEKIVFAGVGKKPSEIRFALEAGIAQFNVESEAEVDLITAEARSIGKRAPVALRVNPDVDAGTNSRITTGTRDTKFGIPLSRAFDVYRGMCRNDALAVRGLSVHIGSQLTRLEPFRQAYRQVVALAKSLRNAGLRVQVLDLGGGFGVRYNKETVPTFEEYGTLVHDETAGLDCDIILEPGRCLVADAGLLLSEVILNKSQESQSFVVLDAAFNDLLRPVLYDAFHEIVPVARRDSGVKRGPVTFVGPVCETTDTFCINADSAALEPGDLVAILTTGAYGAVMASTYNSRRLVPEVLVHGSRFEEIRRRETYDEILRRDRLPSWMI